MRLLSRPANGDRLSRVLRRRPRDARSRARNNTIRIARSFLRKANARDGKMRIRAGRARAQKSCRVFGSGSTREVTLRSPDSTLLEFKPFPHRRSVARSPR